MELKDETRLYVLSELVLISRMPFPALSSSNNNKHSLHTHLNIYTFFVLTKNASLLSTTTTILVFNIVICFFVNSNNPTTHPTPKASQKVVIMTSRNLRFRNTTTNNNNTTQAKFQYLFSPTCDNTVKKRLN